MVDIVSFLIIALLVSMPCVVIIHRTYYRFQRIIDKPRNRKTKKCYTCQDCNSVFSDLGDVINHESVSGHTANHISKEIEVYDEDTTPNVPFITRLLVTIGMIKVKKNA